MTVEIYEGIQDICKTLKRHLPVEFLSYARFYPDGRRICVSDSPIFGEDFVEDYFRSVSNPTITAGLNSLVRIADVNALIVTTDSKLRNLYESMMSDFRHIGVQPPYSILLSKPDYYEEFSFFPSIMDKGAYEKLIANHDVLRHFMFYFQEQAYALIRRAKIHQYTKNENFVTQSEIVDKSCIESMKTKKFFLNTDNCSYLTPREAHCAHLLTKNLNSREIADVMCLSHRTVEEYIERIKAKSNVSSKSQLQAFLAKAGFDHLSKFEISQ